MPLTNWPRFNTIWAISKRLAGNSSPSLEHHPEFEQARVGLAGILIETEKPSEAVTQLKRAIELDPNDEVAWYRLATALLG